MEKFQTRNAGVPPSLLCQTQLSGTVQPELKADENFRQLQAQLEGTENRITTARMDFNNEAQQYNTKVRRFPTNIFAGLFGFHQRPYFQAEAGAEQAPQVKF